MPPSLELFAHQPRYLHGRRRLAIAVTNLGSAPVTVTGVALRAQHFDVLAPESKSSTIAPGSRTDLQVDYGEIATCDQPAPRTADVELALVRDGRTEQHALELDPTFLDELYVAECAMRAVGEAVTIGFGDQPAVSGDRVLTEIVISRVAGDEPIRVESLRGSVVFVMLADGRPSDVAPRPLRVIEPHDASDAVVAIPVEIYVSRCDPHVIGQAQKPYDFRVWITVGDDETVLVGVDPHDALLERLDELVASCEPGRPN